MVVPEVTQYTDEGLSTKNRKLDGDDTRTKFTSNSKYKAESQSKITDSFSVDCGEYDKYIKKTWMDEMPVYVSEDMKQLIKSSKEFSLPPIGPIADHIKSAFLQHSIPASFLQSYIVNSSKDAYQFHQLFAANKEPPPTVVIYPFQHQTHYDGVNMNAQMLEILKSEDTVVANLIVDHFEDHLKGTTLPYEEVQLHNYTSMDSKIVLEQLDESDQKELSTEISTGQSHGRQQSDEDTVSTEQLVMQCEAIKDHQVLGMDVPGSWVLEAKVGKYKYYTRSFLSLLMDKAWVSDEVILSYFFSVVEEQNLNTTVFVMDVAGVNKIFCGTSHDVKILSKVDIFTYEKFIGARHVNNSHWALLVIQPQTEEVVYVDPLGVTKVELQKVGRLWNLYARHQFQAGYWSKKCKWSVNTAQPHPLQKDGWSCGIYVMKFGELILLNKSLSDFCHQRIHNHREEMAVNLL